jgi:hypothetical protein
MRHTVSPFSLIPSLSRVVKSSSSDDRGKGRKKHGRKAKKSKYIYIYNAHTYDEAGFASPPSFPVFPLPSSFVLTTSVCLCVMRTSPTSSFVACLLFSCFPCPSRVKEKHHFFYRALAEHSTDLLKESRLLHHHTPTQQPQLLREKKKTAERKDGGKNTHTK